MGHPVAERPGGGPPSLAMVAAGGVGVLVVVAFVAAIAVGGRTAAPGPGARVGVARADAEGALAVFVPRCEDDRVKIVEVAVDGGAALWRITSRKGSIDERYEAGAEPPPLGFDVEVPLEVPLPSDIPLIATVSVDGEEEEVRDRIAFSTAAVPAEGVLYRGGVVSVGSFQARALSAAACRESRSDLGLTTIAFGLGALVVVGTYGLMVRRWWRGRGAA